MAQNTRKGVLLSMERKVRFDRPTAAVGMEGLKIIFLKKR
jgi:hypothetical protein